MAINLVKGEIKIILETLTEQVNTISQYEGKIPQIELDIIMANIRKLYERFYDLNDINNKHVVVKTEIIENQAPEKKEEKPETRDSVDKKEVITDQVPDTKEIIFEIGSVYDTNDSVQEAKQKEKTEITTKEQSSQVEPPKKLKVEKGKTEDLFSMTEKETVADKFKETNKSVHEKISSEKNDKTVAEKIGKSSIPSLKSAIGINDKFLFINQLFKGDLQGYNKAIDKLNACTNIEQATTALEELRAGNKWDNGDEAYQKLEDLVIRKLL